MYPSAELPLIAFTLLAQLAIGCMLITPVLLWKCDDADIREKISNQRKATLIFMALGAILSIVHLGTPLHSPFTIFNIGSSWLSREILLVILVCFSLGGSIWLQGRDQKRANWLYYISIALGVALLFAMSKVYNSPFMPNWAGAQTFFLFLATALLLGSLWLGWAIAYRLPSNTAEERPIMWKIFLCALVGFLLLAISAPFSIFGTATDLNPGTTAFGIDTLARWRGFQTFLCSLAVLLLAVAVWKTLRGSRPATWLLLALVVGCLGEIAGRCAFYMAYARLGI